MIDWIVRKRLTELTRYFFHCSDDKKKQEQLWLLNGYQEENYIFNQAELVEVLNCQFPGQVTVVNCIQWK